MKARGRNVQTTLHEKPLSCEREKSKSQSKLIYVTRPFLDTVILKSSSVLSLSVPFFEEAYTKFTFLRKD